MTGDEIAKMDYKQLRNVVIELNDNYIKLKRMLDDTLNNLDASNLATTFRKEIDGYSSEFKITAKEISSKVEHIEEGLEQYSTIKQTADKIEMAVNENREYTDGQTQELSSKFSMTAGQISTNVVKVQNNVTKNYSSLQQTAEKIEAIVGEYYDKNEAFVGSAYPPLKSDKDYNENELCLYEGKYYYYNKISRKWLEYNPDEGISGSTTLTPHGLYIRNNVQINGDLITYGTIKGVDYSDTNNLGVLRLSNRSGKYADMIFTKVKDGKDDKELFKVYEGGNGTYVSLFVFGNNIGHGTSSTFYPEGTWDFSKCNVILPKEEGE